MSRSRAVLYFMAVGAATFARESSARADDRGSAEKKPPFVIGTQPVWYLMGGVTTGATVAAADRGGFVGGEASVVRLSRGGRFFGFYGDGYYAFGVDRSYTTTGVELGYKFLGVDGGGAARIGSGRVEWGATGRLFLTLGIVSVYGRYAIFPDPLLQGNEHVIQVGALVKVPFAIWGLE